MTPPDKPRLRFFESAPAQRHITGADHYIYAQAEPRHRVNVIGTGTIGHEHMRVATMLGRVAINGIYDEQAHSMDVAADTFATYSDSELKRFDSLEAAVNDPAADALMICTPNFTHIDVLEVAAKSGKPIFLEKPMATTVADAKRIVEIASDYPSFIQVGLQYRYKAPYAEARHEALERGTVGDIKTLAMSEYRPPFLDKVKQWNKFAECSGGTLVEKCCHYFDLLTLFAGGRPTRVYASGGQAVNFVDFEYEGKPCDIDDHAFVIIDYDNGVRANFTLNMFCPHFYEELVVCGDKGRLVASERFDFQRDDSARSHVSIEMGENGASREIEVGYTKPIEQSGHNGSTFHEHIEFADQLDGKASDAATPLQGLWSIVIAAAAQDSVASGQPVEMNTFVEQHGLDGIL
ncbi:MAG: Gfo/Idh/MocA family oxidoreductase [Woeseiaceae bacterium]|nr:Gfo/Idh/MocA family oxidoreductase [Woeseiaceae bacterium]